MKKSIPGISIFIMVISQLTPSCKPSNYSQALKNETTDIKVKEKPNAISFTSIRRQTIPSFSERASKTYFDTSQTRGFFTPILGGAVSLATNAVKKMIANDRAKYISKYSFALTDLYFYDQLSTESVFDPVGLQFGGFTLTRTFTNSLNKTDTAFIARFELDTASGNEIINNSIFRLKLTDIQIRYSKVKMTKAQLNTLNMDIEISFKTSYVNEIGQLFDNVELGKFYLLVRNAPLDKNDPAYYSYYEKLKGKKVDGRSFIVPRSFGYYKDENGIVGKSYSQGAYSITVKVTENAKDRFVTKVVSDNSNVIIDMIGNGVRTFLPR